MLARGHRPAPRTLVLLTVLAAPSLSGAAPGDGWISAGTAAIARDQQTLTLLADGRVLVTGGREAIGRAIRAVEIYDPVTDVWSAGASMIHTRRGHTATRLGSGKVLVVGGWHDDFFPPLRAEVELYDPATDTWTAGPPLADLRGFHRAVTLADGRVLIVGGLNLPGFASQAEIYDPATNSWSSGGNSGAWNDHTATRLTDGRVMVVAGATGAPPIQNTALYDPLTNTWSASPALAGPRFDHAAVLLPSGQLLVACGRDDLQDLATTEIFDPATLVWQAGPMMNARRTKATMSLLPDGRVLTVGGAAIGPFLPPPEVLDAAGQSWSVAASSATPRHSHVSVNLSNGSVLIHGGRSLTGVLATAEIFGPRPVPPDADGDGVVDVGDACLGTQTRPVNASGCSVADLCPCDGAWSTAGDHVSCVATTAEAFMNAGLMTAALKDATVSAAARSGCGKRR